MAASTKSMFSHYSIHRNRAKHQLAFISYIPIEHIEEKDIICLIQHIYPVPPHKSSIISIVLTITLRFTYIYWIYLYNRNYHQIQYICIIMRISTLFI